MSEAPDPIWRRALGRILGLAIVVSAVGLGWHVTRVNFEFPRTDDAQVRANVVGIAAHVSGPIVELSVVDNQEVKRGDLLFAIDARPYEAALARAQAALFLAQSELDASTNAIASAVAGVNRAEAELDYATKEVKRLVPLLKSQAVEADEVDVARTRERTATAGLEQARQELGRQRNLMAQHGTLNARIAAAEADLRAAQLNVDYCRVRAPFDARVANLNLSVGQFARDGEPLFALVDTRHWYVLANIRETFLESIRPGLDVDVYLMSYPHRRFRGTVQGVGWAVQSEDPTITGVLPEVKPTLNWVRLAQRIPVRIQLEDPSPDRPYRMGMTAFVTVRKNSGALRTVPSPATP
jgi:multidrug efflux system membrane fusion protein